MCRIHSSGQRIAVVEKVLPRLGEDLLYNLSFATGLQVVGQRMQEVFLCQLLQGTVRKLPVLCCKNA